MADSLATKSNSVARGSSNLIILDNLLELGAASYLSSSELTFLPGAVSQLCQAEQPFSWLAKSNNIHQLTHSHKYSSLKFCQSLQAMRFDKKWKSYPIFSLNSSNISTQIMATNSMPTVFCKSDPQPPKPG